MEKVLQKVLAAFGILIPLFFTVATSNAAVMISKDSSTIGNIIIMEAGASDADNGTALRNTLEGLTGDSSNRYVIRLGPGTYDVGTTNLAMKDYVDIEGSGENVTVITGNPDGPATVTAFGVSNAELRFLTVRNTGGGNAAVAIGTGSGGVKITHVYAEASGSANNHAIENHCPSPPCATVFMRSVFASAGYTGGGENIGIWNDSSSAVAMIDVIANAFSDVGDSFTNIGIKNNTTAPVMLDVYVMAYGGANTYGIYNDTTGGQMFNVYAFATNATASNTGVLNQNSSQPAMRNIRTEGSGGADSTGMANTNCVTGSTVANITAIGRSASNNNIGMLNNGCSFTLISLHASSTPVRPGAYHAGVKNVDASPKIESSVVLAPTVDANCGGGCYGVHNTGSGTVKIDSSQIYTALTSSAAATIKNGSNVTTYVGNSKLDGNAVVNDGTIKCIGVYNATYDALDNTCMVPTP